MTDVIIKVVAGCTNKKKDNTPSKIIISNKNVMIATKYFKKIDISFVQFLYLTDIFCFKKSK